MNSDDGDVAARTPVRVVHPEAINIAAQSTKLFSGVQPEVTKGRQRWAMLVVIGLLFVALNTAVIWLIHNAMIIDVSFTSLHPEFAEKRIISSAVFQTLIGATVVQTGAVTWAMARFLFPNQSD